jgi:hypothetical protein
MDYMQRKLNIKQWPSFLQYLKLTFFFSGNDELLPSSKEAKRLCSTLQHGRSQPGDRVGRGPP